MCKCVSNASMATAYNFFWAHFEHFYPYSHPSSIYSLFSVLFHATIQVNAICVIINFVMILAFLYIIYIFYLATDGTTFSTVATLLLSVFFAKDYLLLTHSLFSCFVSKSLRFHAALGH